MNTYGQELILDLSGCNASLFNRSHLERYFTELCELIDMKKCEVHFWDDLFVAESERQTEPHTKGTSAVCFILTSSIVIHTLDILECVYVNIFSCKEFNIENAVDFTKKAFEASECVHHTVTRR